MNQKNYHINEIKAGLYILLAFLAFCGMLLTVSHQDGMGAKKLYFADFDFVNGIEKGAIVRFGGMKAGAVSQMEVSPENPQLIRVGFKVHEDIPVKEDSLVVINSIGVMGDYYLEVIPGSKEAVNLKSGSVMSSIPAVRLDEFFRNLSGIAAEVKDITGSLSEKIENVLDQSSRDHLRNIIAKGDDLSMKIDTLVGNLNNFTGDESQQKFGDILSNIKEFSNTLKEKTDGTLTSIEKLAVRLEKLTGENQDEITDIIQKILKTADNLEQITSEKKEDIKAMVTDLRTSAGYIEEVMRKNKGNVSDALHNIRVASENTRDFTRKISLYPWTLIWRSKTEPQYRPKAER